MDWIECNFNHEQTPQLGVYKTNDTVIYWGKLDEWDVNLLELRWTKRICWGKRVTNKIQGG